MYFHLVTALTRNKITESVTFHLYLVTATKKTLSERERVRRSVKVTV